MKRVKRQSFFCPPLAVFIIIITSIVSLGFVILLTVLLAQKEDTGVVVQEEKWAGTYHLVLLARENNVKVFATTHPQTTNAVILVHERLDQTQQSSSSFLSATPPVLDCSGDNNATKVACSILEILGEQTRKRSLLNTLSPPNETNHGNSSSDQALICYIVNSFNAQIVSGMEWTFDSTNPYGIGFDWLYYMARKAMDTWQANTVYYLWGNAKFGTPLGPVNTDVMNSQNGFKFGILKDENGYTNSILAVTITWFDQVGGAWKIVRWNQVYNSGLSNQWGDGAQKSNVFDFPGILLHELGHSFGIMDIYPSGCSDVTMFHRGDLGETKKRTLESPDITGERQLYGGGSRSSSFNKVGANEVAPPVYGSSTTPAPLNGGSTTTRPKTNDQRSEMCHFSFCLIAISIIFSI